MHACSNNCHQDPIAAILYQDMQDTTPAPAEDAASTSEIRVPRKSVSFDLPDLPLSPTSDETFLKSCEDRDLESALLSVGQSSVHPAGLIEAREIGQRYV